MIHSPRVRVLLVFVLLALCGCGMKQKPSPRGEAEIAPPAEEAFHVFSGDYQIDKSLSLDPPTTVAVLPFSGNGTSWSMVFEDEPPEIVRRAFYSHFARLPFLDQELGDTDARLASAGLDDPVRLRLTLENRPAELANLLGVDAVVIGEVTHFDRVFLGVLSQIAVGCRLEFHDLRTGKRIWWAEHVSRDAGGGFSLNPIGWAFDAIASIWNLRGNRLLLRADDLMRDLVASIERHLSPSFSASIAPAPRVDLFACAPQDRPYKAGESIVLVLVGDRGAATAALPGLTERVPLAPLGPLKRAALAPELDKRIRESLEQAGIPATQEIVDNARRELALRVIYQGAYVVQPGDAGRNIMARGKLEVEHRGATEIVDAVNLVDVDAMAPSPPAGPRMEKVENGLILRWEASPEPDVLGYAVEVSESPMEGWRMADKTTKTSMPFMDLENFTELHARVRAFDLAGNLSEPSVAVSGRSEPEDDLRSAESSILEGKVEGRLLLKAERSPYTVRKTLTVLKESALVLEPGVTLRFQPEAGLVIDGGVLLAYGRAEAPIVFEPSSELFEGLTVQHGGGAVIQRTIIRGARVGLRVAGASPTLESVSITNCAQAGLLLGEGAKPILACCRVAENTGMGGLVVEGLDVAPRVRQSVFEDNLPFNVQNHSPLHLDLERNYFDGATPKTLGPVELEPMLTTPPGCVDRPASP